MALVALDLSINQVVDLTPFTDLIRLRYLDLSGNQSRDLGPLADLDSLEVLILTGNEVGDASALLDLTRLRELEVSQDPPPALAAVASLLSERGVQVSLSNGSGGSGGGQARSRLAEVLHTALAFTSDRDGYYNLYVLLPDSTELKLTDFAGSDYSPAWSPDGKQLAFVRTQLPGSDIHLINADGTGLVRIEIPGLAESEPAWSPDGRQLLVTGRPEGATGYGATGLWLIELATAEASLLLDDPILCETGPSWSSDGAYIAYQVPLVEDWRQPEQIARRGIYVGRAADMHFDPVAPLSGRPTWHPTEHRFAYVSVGDESVCIKDADGGSFAVLYTGNGSDGEHPESPAWSPDGQWIAFVSSSTNKSDLCVVRADGTGFVRLIENEPYYTKPWHLGSIAWKPR